MADDSLEQSKCRLKAQLIIYVVGMTGLVAVFLWAIITNYQQMVPCVVTNLHQNLTEYPCFYVNTSGTSCDEGNCYSTDPAFMGNCSTLSLTLKWQNCAKDFNYIFTDRDNNFAKYGFYDNGPQCFYKLNYCDDPFRTTVDNTVFIFMTCLLIVIVIGSVALTVWLVKILRQD